MTADNAWRERYFIRWQLGEFAAKLSVTWGMSNHAISDPSKTQKSIPIRARLYSGQFTALILCDGNFLRVVRIFFGHVECQNSVFVFRLDLGFGRSGRKRETALN